MNTTKKRILTGITTTGIPHLGNYVGSIRPAIAEAHRAFENHDGDAFSFWQIIMVSSNALTLMRFIALLGQLPPLGWHVVLILKKLFFIVNRTFLRFLNWHGYSIAHVPRG